MMETGGVVSFDGLGLKLDTERDAYTLCKIIERKKPKVLILSGNTFGIGTCVELGAELAKLSHLEEAHFKDMFTSRGRDEVPIALGHLLDGITNSGAKLKFLDLSDNAIGPVGAPPVIRFLEGPSANSLEKLYLNNCGLGPEGSSSIAVPLARLKVLKEFICGRNRLENKGVTSMSKSFSELGCLEVLRLPQNGIHVKGIKAFAEALERNIKTIREIDLSDNTIKLEGCKALGDVLIASENLRKLKLDDALLENRGFKEICEALTKSTVLNSLELASFEGNELHGKKTVELILQTFSNNSPEFSLNLSENEFSTGQLADIQMLSEKFHVNLDEPCSDFDEEGKEDDDVDSDDLSDDSDDSDAESGDTSDTGDNGPGGAHWNNNH